MAGRRARARGWRARPGRGYTAAVNTPTLTGSGLVLRPLDAVADAPALFVAHSDPEVHRYWSGLPHTSVAQTAEYNAGTLAMDGAEVWAITRDGGEALGRIALFGVREGVGELGLLLRRDAQRQGLAARALALVEGYAFGERGMRRLQADTDPENAACLALFERAGYQREGLQREAWLTHLGLRDSVLLGKLRG